MPHLSTQKFSNKNILFLICPLGLYIFPYSFILHDTVDAGFVYKNFATLYYFARF